MNNRERSDLLRLNGINSLDVIRPADMVLICRQIEDLSQFSIEQETAIQQLQNQIRNLQNALARIADLYDNQIRILNNRTRRL